MLGSKTARNCLVCFLCDLEDFRASLGILHRAHQPSKSHRKEVSNYFLYTPHVCRSSLNLNLLLIASLKVPLFISKRKQEPALPRPFELPINFSLDIMAGLQEEHLVGNPRRKFITAVANAIFHFKNYPTDEEYHHVAQQVIKKWKFLDTGGGCVSY